MFMKDNQYVRERTSTDRLLQVIIALLLRQKEDQVVSLKRQIEILQDLGMRPVEIAETLGRTSTYINKELSNIRKTRKREE
jgi:hypothetical protein